jgi:Cdc6-like AAA superfamily ATPase
MLPVTAGDRPDEGTAISRSSATLQRFVGEHVSTATEHWQDRDQLRADLRAALLEHERARRILSVTGRRGIGKSATVGKVIAEFERADPSRSPLEDLDGIVSLSTRTGVGSLTLARIFEELTRLLPTR